MSEVQKIPFKLYKTEKHDVPESGFHIFMKSNKLNATKLYKVVFDDKSRIQINVDVEPRADSYFSYELPYLLKVTLVFSTTKITYDLYPQLLDNKIVYSWYINNRFKSSCNSCRPDKTHHSVQYALYRLMHSIMIN